MMNETPPGAFVPTRRGFGVSRCNRDAAFPNGQSSARLPVFRTVGVLTHRDVRSSSAFAFSISDNHSGVSAREDTRGPKKSPPGSGVRRRIGTPAANARAAFHPPVLSRDVKACRLEACDTADWKSALHGEHMNVL
jgi:hypothetical protein